MSDKITKCHAESHRVEWVVKQRGFGQIHLPAAQLDHFLWICNDQQVYSCQVPFVDRSILGGPLC